MKKFIGVLFGVLGFAVKAFVLLSIVIVGIDLFNKHMDEKNGLS